MVDDIELTNNKAIQKIAVFPGSFDPITVGHLDLVKRALPLFDRIVVAIGQNSNKKYLYTLERRLQFIETIFKDEPKVDRNAYKGLTTDFCETENAQFILRGLRSGTDFDYEKTIALLNRELKPGIETIFLMSAPQYSHISSTVVREIIINHGNAKPFVPEAIQEML